LAKKTQQYATSKTLNQGAELINNQDIPFKPPDIAHLVFFGFGFLKQRVFQLLKMALESFK
jgi:hypothetical protein